MTARERADLFVRRGVFESRKRAKDAIAAGLVTADGAVVAKTSEAGTIASPIAGGDDNREFLIGAARP